MRTRTSIEVVPQDAFEHVFLGCDDCDFELEDLGDNKATEKMLRHVAEKHCAAETRGSDKDFPDYYRFETEDKLKLFVDGKNADRDGHDWWYGNWAGPGWYHYKFRREWANCRCGSCENEFHELRALTTIIDDHMKESERQVQEAVALAQSFGLPNPKKETT